MENEKEMDVLAERVEVLVGKLEGILPQLDKDFHYDVST